MGEPEWASWLKEQKRAERFESHFEYSFAQKVLSRVPGLSPDDVTPQQEFVDVNGRTRRMDFAIVCKGQRVAIEVDGFDKKGDGGGMTSAEHADYALRERSLTHEGWKVLRFANREIYDDAQALSMQIWATLNRVDSDAAGASAAAVPAASIDVPLPAPDEPGGERSEVKPSPEFGTPPPTRAPQGSPSGWRGRATWVLAAAGVVVIVVLIALAGGDPESEPATQPGVDPISVDDCPADAPIKGNISEDDEQIFHQASDDFYDRTNPEICFATAADAEAAGFQPARR